MNISKALTWDDLANLHDKNNPGQPARTRPMDSVFDWAERQKDKFWVDPKEGTIHKILNKDKK